MDSMDAPFTITSGPGPLIATAIHDGHALRSDLHELVSLDEASRSREEDPHTGRIARVVPTHLIAKRSRFEVDLNRPRASAVYVKPEDAWGLALWHAPPAEDVIARSLEIYDAFYGELRAAIASKIEEHGCVAILDIHSYNHCRERTPADPAMNPEVNVGTGTVNGLVWRPLVDRFLAELRASGFDARENVKFQGGEMSKWIHRTFPANAVCLAVEFKKTFMDEWTGTVDEAHVARLARGIASTLPGLVEELRCTTGDRAKAAR
jgi:N-formylglutamate deformylase